MQDLQLHVTCTGLQWWPLFPPAKPRAPADVESALQKHKVSIIYADRVIPALKDIERLSLYPLLTSDLESLLARLPQYPNLRWALNYIFGNLW